MVEIEVLTNERSCVYPENSVYREAYRPLVCESAVKGGKKPLKYDPPTTRIGDGDM